jgi:hypothetical protein
MANRDINSIKISKDIYRSDEFKQSLNFDECKELIPEADKRSRDNKKRISIEPSCEESRTDDEVSKSCEDLAL